jgi:hypothetical protein
VSRPVRPWLVALVLAALLCGCASTRSFRTLSVDGRQCIVFVESAARDLPRATTSIRLAPDLFITRVPDRDRTWIGQIVWYQFQDAPDMIVSWADLMKLDEQGVVSGSTVLNLISHEVLVKGEGSDEAEAALKARRTGRPPRELVRMAKRGR